MNEEMKLELARQIEWMFENYLKNKEYELPTAEETDSIIEDVISLIDMAETIK